MSDKSYIVPQKLKKLQLETTVSRKTIVKKYKRSSKTVKRKNRRKRSKKAYFNMLKKERIFRGTQELCNSIQQFNVVDIDMTPMCDVNKLPEEVTEWQNQDQIAYWKSRAISLEIENKMLRQHLRNVYAQQIEYYDKSKDWQELPNASDGIGQGKHENLTSTTECSETSYNSTSINRSETKSEMIKELPKEPTGKNRLQEMEKIYGDMAPKIMGMETAIELNYERLIEEGSPVYWPNIPLKL